MAARDLAPVLEDFGATFLLIGFSSGNLPPEGRCCSWATPWVGVTAKSVNTLVAIRTLRN